MRVTIEPVSGGLVTARDPSTLQPGELQTADGVMYLPDTDSVWRQPGGSFWSTVASVSASVQGMAACKFDNGTHLLVAQASGKLWTADAETDNSAFASATINCSGRSDIDRLTSAPFDTRHYIFDGVNENRVLLSDGTSRQHGLLAVTQLPEYISTSAVGFSASVTGYYEYWYTEVVKFADGQELESSYDNPRVLTVLVASTGTAPVIEFPGQPANAGVGVACSYNVYRSEMKSAENDVLYPVGRMIYNLPTSNNIGINIRVTYTDTSDSSNTGVKTASSNDATVLLGVTAVVTDLDTITFTRNTGTTTGHDRLAIVRLHNFSLGTFVGNVVGIAVSVTARCSVADCAQLVIGPVHRASSSTIDVMPAQGASPAFIPGIVSNSSSPANVHAQIGLGTIASRTRTITNTTNTQYTFGDATDDFLPAQYSWRATDFDSNFGLQIGVEFLPSVSGTQTATIDGVSVTVYYAATSAATKSDQRVYPSIIVEEAGAELRYGANGRPPKASMGVEFEGCLVTNDVAHPNKLCWSIPGNPDYFPTGVYWLDLPGDGITGLGVANNRLIVGMSGRLYRINYLPNESDASFSRGRAFELLSSSVGILHQNCISSFTTPDGRQELALADANGIFSTDAYSVRKLSADLQWVGPQATSVFPPSLSSGIAGATIALLNDPRTQTIRFLTTQDSGRYFAGSYAARHAKPNGLKWSKCSAGYNSGNVFVPSAAVCFRRATGAWIAAYAYASGLIPGAGGGVTREDSHDTATLHTVLNSVLAPVVRTREIYDSGIGGESELGSIIIHGVDRETGNSTKNIGGTASISQYYTNATRNTASTATITGGTSNCRLAEIGVGSVNCDGFSMGLAIDTTGMFELQSIGLRTESFGESDNRA